MAVEGGDEMLDETEAQQVNEEYKIWKKNTPFLYDLVITHALEWPSLTVQWLPTANTPSTSHDSAVHYLLLGTHTSGDEPNHLIRARVHLPLQDVEADALDHPDDTLDYPGFGIQYCKVQIIQQISHAGEVNRARYMPQKPVIIATKSVSAEIYVFDYTKHPSKACQECSPYLRLQGHRAEGYGLSWSTLKEGYLLSGSYDAKICLWDINCAATSNGILRAIHTLQAHSSVVEDVAWHSSLDYLFGSVGDDRQLFIWDIRASNEGPSQSVEAHEAEVNCLAFNPFNEYLLATGSADRTLALHDLRRLSKRLHTFSNHTEEVYQIGWNPKIETILASCAVDKRVMIWDLSRIGEEQTPEDAEDGPPELLFIHGGHTSKISDFSWNQQADGMMGSVAEDNILQIWQMAESIYHDEDDGVDWSLIQS